MAHECIDVERLAEIAEAGPESPLRREVEACPRCRTLLKTYLAFQEGSPAPGSAPEKARQELAAFLEARIERAVSPRRRPAPAAWWTRVRSALNWPKLAPAAAAAAVALAVVLWAPWEPGAPPLERGDTTEAIRLDDARTANDTLSLSWSPHPNATAYRVVLYRPDLSELTRLEPVAQPEAALAIDSLPDIGAGPLVWRVFALQEGDVIASSAPGYITLP